MDVLCREEGDAQERACVLGGVQNITQGKDFTVCDVVWQALPLNTTEGRKPPILETHTGSTGVWQWIDDSLLSQWEIKLSPESHSERFILRRPPPPPPLSVLMPSGLLMKFKAVVFLPSLHLSSPDTADSHVWFMCWEMNSCPSQKTSRNSPLLFWRESHVQIQKKKQLNHNFNNLPTMYFSSTRLHIHCVYKQSELYSWQRVSVEVSNLSVKLYEGGKTPFFSVNKAVAGQACCYRPWYLPSRFGLEEKSIITISSYGFVVVCR